MSEVSSGFLFLSWPCGFSFFLLQLFWVEKTPRPRLAKLSRVQSSETIGVGETCHVYDLDDKLLKIYSPEN